MTINHQSPCSAARSGFTIIEVTISMAFASVLFITITVITVNILGLYQKGLTIRSVNSTGQELVDEFSRAVAAAPIQNLQSSCNTLGLINTTEIDRCKADNAKLTIFQEVESNGAITLTNGTNTGGAVPLNGTFCTGNYSYIWNTGYATVVGDSGRASVRYRNSANQTQTNNNFRLIRIKDYNRNVCRARIGNGNGRYELNSAKNFTYDLTSFNQNPYDELLDGSEDNLILYDFHIFTPTQDTTVTEHIFYSGTFILGTNQGSVNIRNNGNYCTDIPDNLTTDFDYCAINKFNFAMRATGRSQ